MIATEMHDGQGLGNQLWCYAVARCLVLDHGYDFGLIHPEKFKGKDFLIADPGKKVSNRLNRYEEKALIHPLSGADIRGFDEKLSSIADNTELIGYFQDENYILGHRAEIKKWFSLKDGYDCLEYASDDICIINFRGGGYVQEKDFFLPKRYWRNAMATMRKIRPGIRFVVVTEDTKTAKKFFPELEVHHWSIAKDYAVIHNAHYLIMSNSSFAFFPAWTSDRLEYAIAPKYWGRHNISDGYWSLGESLSRGWMYQDRRGKLETYAECRAELDRWKKNNADIVSGENSYNPGIATHIRNIRSIFSVWKKESGIVRASRDMIAYLGSKMWIKTKKSIWNISHSFSVSAKKTLKKIRDGYERKNREQTWDRREKEITKTWLSAEEIKAYRKKIKIYDVFTFFNELDLLEIRLNILDPYVDYFVITESTKTFSGDQKPLHFAQNRERFKKWEKKIIYYAVTDAPENEDELRARLTDPSLDPLDRETIEYVLTSDTISRDTSHWMREFYIKEAPKKALALAHPNDDDICYISDLDEIWDPKRLVDYSKENIFKLRQKGYQYYLNDRTDEDEWYGWTGTVVTKWKNLKNESVNLIRTHKRMRSTFTFLSRGGWHFSFLGGKEGAERKIVESNHFWYKTEDTLAHLSSRVSKNTDYRGRNIHLWKDERDLPDYVIANKETYKKLFL